MAQSSGAHDRLRQEGVEMPPDISYRFVVGLGTLRAADSAGRTAFQKKSSWWQRVIAEITRFIVGALLIALFGWLSFQIGDVVYRALDATQYFGGGAFVPIITFLVFVVAYLGLFTGLRTAMRRLRQRLVTLRLQRIYRELYLDNEFLLEGRKSHLWLDERSGGAILRWSSFEQLVEFEEGILLFLRRRTTYAARLFILISKESRPGSCTWSELREYLVQRFKEGEKYWTEAQEASNPKEMSD